MKRMGLALLLCAACVSTLAVASSAQAFHTPTTFADAPGAGGAGNLYYVGSPRERGWTCASCHVQSEQALQVRFVSDLFSGFEYEPGQRYPVTVRITEELRGTTAGRSNFNGMVLSTLDGEDAPAGSYSNAPADRYEVRSTSTGDLAIASAGRQPGELEWAFDWVAPEAGTGSVTFYLGVVDGNGADSAADETLTDPFGDALYMAEVTVRERGATSASLSPPAPQRSPELPADSPLSPAQRAGLWVALRQSAQALRPRA